MGPVIIPFTFRQINILKLCTRLHNGSTKYFITKSKFIFPEMVYKDSPAHALPPDVKSENHTGDVPRKPNRYMAAAGILIQ